MKSLANLVQKNPYFVVIGWLCTVIAFIIATVAPIIQRRRKVLSCVTSTNVLVSNTLSKVKGISVTYGGTQINQLAVTSMNIYNSGNVTIEDSHLHKNHELMIKVPSGVKIIDVEITNQSTDTIGCEIKNICDETADVRFQTFEKKDKVTINIYHTGNATTEVLLDGKIKDGRINNRNMSDLLETIINATAQSILSSSVSILKSDFF